MSDWKDCIGNYPPFGQKKFKTTLADVLYKMMVRSLDYVAKVKFTAQNIGDCECHFETVEGIAFCCGGKKISERCSDCKEMESNARNCYYCKQYGKFIHFKELEDKEKRQGKTRFVSIGEELKVALWLSLTKMVREVELTFDSPEARGAPADKQVSFVVNWVLDNNIETPIIPIITAIGEKFESLGRFKDDFGLTSELIKGLRASLSDAKVEDSTVNTLATKYVDFLKVLALSSTRMIWQKRQLFSVEMFNMFIDMYSDMVLGPDFLSMLKFSDLVQEYIDIIRENKKRIKEQEAKEKEETDETS